MMQNSGGECELKRGMQAENGIIYTSNMSGEMHMWRRRDARMRYSAAYPTGAERCLSYPQGASHIAICDVPRGWNDGEIWWKREDSLTG